MPSSTSNSNDRIPACPYGRFWFLVLFMCLALLVVEEGAFRIRGYFPTLNDTRELWAYWRGRVYTSKGRRRIVIIGASRAQLGIVPEVLEQEFPQYDVVHLAIDGTGCYAALEDLANDPQFDGVVLCSFHPTIVSPSRLDDQRGHIEYYRNNRMSLNRTVNLRLSCMVQGHVCVMDSYDNPKYILQGILRKRSHDVPCIRTQFNRYRQAFYHARRNSEQLANMRASRLTAGRELLRNSEQPIDAFLEAVDQQIVPLCRMMFAKQGAVIFLRMPESGEYWDETNRVFPKEMYWDKFAERCPAPAIHFLDYPSLSKFTCPEGSHLDYADAVQFTRTLSRIIIESGCLP